MALVFWTFVMWFWMYFTRIPAIKRARMKLDPCAPRGEQMSQLPPVVRWKADNYNHLMEQPQIFYAVCLVIAIAGDSSASSLILAWAYVVLRVVHSLIQSLVNIIEVRFAVFALSSFVLMALAVRALLNLIK